MATKTVELPLIVIVGPTASGKTALAIRLAKQFDGEIICADSRTVYKDLNIGTAKPTKAEQASAVHWGLDLVSPDKRFTAADFKMYADKKMAEVRARGKIPFLVGGTGLYIDAILFDYQFGTQADRVLRSQLEEQTIDELLAYCTSNNITAPENSQNKRYIIRAIEQNGVNHKRNQVPLQHSIIVGIATEKDDLRRRIEARTEHIFENCVVDEAIMLGKKYGWESEAMTANVYSLTKSYLEDEQSLTEIKEKNTTLDWRLAKRQLTWLKRNRFIKWYSLEDAEHYITSQLLANEHTA